MSMIFQTSKFVDAGQAKDFSYTFQRDYDFSKLRWILDVGTTDVYIAWQWYSIIPLITQANSLNLGEVGDGQSMGSAASGSTVYWRILNNSSEQIKADVRIFAEFLVEVVVEEVIEEIEIIVVDDVADDAEELTELVKQADNVINIDLGNVLGDLESYLSDSSYEVSSAVEILATKAAGSIDGLTNIVSNSLTSLTGTIGNIASRITDGIQQYVGDRITDLTRITGFIGDNVKAGLDKTIEAISNMVNTGWGVLFKGITNAVMNIGSSIAKALIDAIFEPEEPE